MDCQELHLLGPLIDGELPPARAEQVLEHARSCPVCAAELDELRAVSRLVTVARQRGMGQMPDDAMDRLKLHVQGLVESADVGLIWMARAFSGLAASILIAGLWLLNQPVDAPPAQTASRDHVAMTAAATLIIDPPTTVSAPDLRSPEAVLDDLAGTNLSSASWVTETELP